MSVRCRCSVSGVRDRVHAVEGMGHVDEPALLADRRDGLLPAHAARDLALEEEPDHLALAVGLDLLARDHDQLAVAGVVGGLERAAEDVVVGDGDRAEALGLGVVDELGGVDAAVVRPRRVHVQVGDDPRAVVERVDRMARAPPRLQRRVDRLELTRDVGEVLALGLAAGARAFALPVRVVLGQACGCSSGELRLPLDAAWMGDRAACRLRLERDAAQPVDAGHEDRGAVFRSAAREAPSRAVRTCTRCARSRGIAGRPISGRVRSRTTSQPGRSRTARSTPRATTRSLGRSSTTIVFDFVAGREQRRVDAGRDEAVVAREPLLGSGAHRLRSARAARRVGRAASRAASGPGG